jgi:tetratricopeptide (TPR) repeat protein
MNEGTRLIIGNLELARKLNNNEAFCYAAFSYCRFASAPHHAGERLKLAEELAQKPLSGISPCAHTLADATIGSTLLEFGKWQRANTYFDDLRETATRSGQANLLIASMLFDTLLATIEGRLEDALAISQGICARGHQLGLDQYALPIAIFGSFGPLLFLGRLDEIVRLFGNSQILSLPFFRAETGQDEEVIRILEQWVVKRPGIGSTDDETAAGRDILFLKAAVRIGHRQATELLLNRFSGSAMRISLVVPTCISRHLGAAAALLGRHEEARKHYDEALKVATDMSFRPELALTRLQLAELLLEHYPEEKADALGHLDFAVKEFRDMKMQPSLDRAQKLLQS